MRVSATLATNTYIRIVMRIDINQIVVVTIAQCTIVTRSVHNYTIYIIVKTIRYVNIRHLTTVVGLPFF